MCARGENLYGTCLLALQAVRRLAQDLQLHERAARQATLEAERLQSLHQQLQELQAACQGSQAPGGGPRACLTEQLDSARQALPARGVLSKPDTHFCQYTASYLDLSCSLS